MRNQAPIRLTAMLLLAAMLFSLLPVVPVTAAAAENKAVVPFAYCHASAQSEETAMSGVKYSDAILFTMGYNGQSNGAVAEVTYNFQGQYSSLSFTAGYVKGWERDATLTVIADGVTVKDEAQLKYTDVAKSHTVSLAGVSSLTIRFTSDGYDKTYYAIANVKATAASNKKEAKTLVSDEFYHIPCYLLEGTEVKTGAFSMGGYDYENGYLMKMGYSWTYDYTASLYFNFENRYKKLTFDIARFTGGESITYTRSAFLTIEADGEVLAGYDEKEMKWNDLSLPVTVDLNGVNQLAVHVYSNGYDRVDWAMGNIQLVSDGKAHGILLDMDQATVTEAQPTVDLNPRVYPSDAKNKKFSMKADGEVFASVDDKGVVTGHYKGNAIITATTEDGGYTAVCDITSKLPAFALRNHYEPKYVETTIDFTNDSWDFVQIMGDGEGSVAGGLARAYEEANRHITDGFGGSVKRLSDVLSLKIELENQYDFLLADLMQGTMSVDIYTSLLNDEMLDAMSDVVTYLGGIVAVPEGLLAEKAIVDFAELPDVINTQTQASWAKIKNVFTSKVTYEQAGRMFSVLGGAVDLAGAVADGCDDVGKLMEYYVLCNAFANANAEYMNILKATAKKLEGKDSEFAKDLSAAVDSLVGNMKNQTEEFPAMFYLSCGEELAQFSMQTAKIVKDLLGNLTEGVSILGAIESGVKIGHSLADAVTSSDDRFKYGQLLRMAGFMAEGLHAVVMERQETFEKSEKYEDAESLSAAIDLYLNLQILACDYGIAYFQAHSSALLGKVKIFSEGALQDARNLKELQNKLQRLKDNGRWIFFDDNGTINGFVAACPVTVIVETKDGTEIARMETGSLTVAPGYEWIYRLMGEDHEQKAGFYDPALHTVRIIAQESGTMNLVRFTGTGDTLTNGESYIGIPVEKGETYVLKEEYLIRDREAAIKADEVFPAVDFENPFADVPEGAYYYDPVMWAVRRGITTGMTETTFAPDGTCTRAQIVTFLWRASGSPEPAAGQMPFADVAAGAYYETAVRWAVEQGITKGTSDTTFGPDMPCTRGQVVTFLWRALDEQLPESSTNPFLDVSAEQYYYNPVLWAVENKITNGMAPDAFSPDAPCSRGQIVTFLYRALVLQ